MYRLTILLILCLGAVLAVRTYLELPLFDRYPAVVILYMR